MDLTNLKQNHPRLISYMEGAGYRSSYIHNVKAEIDRILCREKDNPWSSYLDIYRDYETTSLASKQSLICKATLIGILANFDIEGLYPNGRRRHSLWERNAYAQLLPEFKELVDHYENTASTLKISTKTLNGNMSAMSNFLHALQGMGCDCLIDVHEKHVLQYFTDDNNKGPCKSAGYKNVILKTLKLCSDYSEECLRIASFFPPMHNRRKNIQYITGDEITQLRACADNGLIQMRDKAILFLLLYTGIRGCDIAGLTFYSIDWKSDRFHVVQQKTAVPLELPLSPIVGNAIFDYITRERPDSNNEHIFLSKKTPHFPLTARGIGPVINGVMRKASIRQNPDDRKGTHIFRHHAATSMLENGVPRPVITQALGHAAPDSLDIYLHADFVHLKECSIGIEEYPVSEEVFAL